MKTNLIDLNNLICNSCHGSAWLVCSQNIITYSSWPLFPPLKIAFILCIQFFAVHQIPFQGEQISLLSFYKCLCSTAKRILERRGIQTSSSVVKIRLVCIPEFKVNFLFFWHLFDFLSRISRKSHFNFGKKFEFKLQLS